MAVPEFVGGGRADHTVGPSPNSRSSSLGDIVTVGVLVVLFAGGFAARLVVARESIFADELSTYWIVQTHSLHGVLSLIYGTSKIKHAEITPPLYFVLSWLCVQLGHTVFLMRLPSLIAGTLTIGVVYLLGLRTVGPRRALIATTVVTVAPFMVYYSTEARAYGVLMLLVTGSTLCLLTAIDTGRRRWWVGYAVCACLAFWTHNTSTFILVVQFAWALWAHPRQRRPLLWASAGAVVGVIPWLPGLLNELHSPTLQILSDLSPFNLPTTRTILGHYTMGYPFASTGLDRLPGRDALIVIGLGAAVAVAGLGFRLSRDRPRSISVHPQDRILLIVALTLATPVGEALYSAFGTHVFGLRNLAASWPELALLFSVLVTAAGPVLGLAAVGLIVLGLARGTELMVAGTVQRPDYNAAAAYVDRVATGRDVVLNENVYLSPGPLTALDVALKRKLRVVRALAPAETSHPFTLRDPYVSLPQATRAALAELPPGGRVIVVSNDGSAETLSINAGTGASGPGAGFRRVGERSYAGPVVVATYAQRSAASHS